MAYCLYRKFLRLNLTKEQEKLVNESSQLSAVGFVDNTLYHSLLTGDRDSRIKKLRKFFRIRHSIQIVRGTKFITEYEGDQMIALVFSARPENKFTQFDIYFHFVLKMFFVASFQEIRNFFSFAE